MAARRAPTMLDVARLAGTSKATVSNVMQGYEHVRPETRERVLSAIATLGYKVNLGARSLARQQSNVLGMLLGDLENPWYATLAAHIERLARARGYAVLIASTGGEPMRNEGGQVEASRVLHLVEHRVAAIVLLAFSGDPAIQQHVAPGIPLVFVGTHGPGTSVTVDDRLGAHLAVTHLLDLGHRRIGYVNRNADGDPLSDDERFASFRQTLAAAGAPVETADVVRLEGPDTNPVEAIDALLGSPERPTAIFAASDLSAIEVLDRADALGLRIPGDLSLVGFDDINMARLKRVSLTTIAQPALELATKATTAAIALATSDGDGSDLAEDVARNTILAPRLVVRGTTGPPRSA
jgi:LacI family transcriptional regulator